MLRLVVALVGNLVSCRLGSLKAARLLGSCPNLNPDGFASRGNCHNTSCDSVFMVYVDGAIFEQGKRNQRLPSQIIPAAAGHLRDHIVEGYPKSSLLCSSFDCGCLALGASYGRRI